MQQLQEIDGGIGCIATAQGDDVGDGAPTIDQREQPPLEDGYADGGDVLRITFRMQDRIAMGELIAGIRLLIGDAHPLEQQVAQIGVDGL